MLDLATDGDGSSNALLSDLDGNVSVSDIYGEDVYETVLNTVKNASVLSSYNVTVSGVMDASVDDVSVIAFIQP